MLFPRSSIDQHSYEMNVSSVLAIHSILVILRFYRHKESHLIEPSWHASTLVSIIAWGDLSCTSTRMPSLLLCADAKDHALFVNYGWFNIVRLFTEFYPFCIWLSSSWCCLSVVRARRHHWRWNNSFHHILCILIPLISEGNILDSAYHIRSI